MRRVIALQYNPDTLTRTLQMQGGRRRDGDRLEALRLKGPPVETIKLEAEIDATDQLEFPDDNRDHGAARLFIRSSPRSRRSSTRRSAQLQTRTTPRRSRARSRSRRWRRR